MQQGKDEQSKQEPIEITITVANDPQLVDRTLVDSQDYPFPIVAEVSKFFKAYQDEGHLSSKIKQVEARHLQVSLITDDQNAELLLVHCAASANPVDVLKPILGAPYSAQSWYKQEVSAHNGDVIFDSREIFGKSHGFHCKRSVTTSVLDFSVIGSNMNLKMDWTPAENAQEMSDLYIVVLFGTPLPRDPSTNVFTRSTPYVRLSAKVVASEGWGLYNVPGTKLIRQAKNHLEGRQLPTGPPLIPSTGLPLEKKTTQKERKSGVGFSTDWMLPITSKQQSSFPMFAVSQTTKKKKKKTGVKGAKKTKKKGGKLLKKKGGKKPKSGKAKKTKKKKVRRSPMSQVLKV